MHELRVLLTVLIITGEHVRPQAARYSPKPCKPLWLGFESG